MPWPLLPSLLLLLLRCTAAAAAATLEPLLLLLLINENHSAQTDVIRSCLASVFISAALFLDHYRMTSPHQTLILPISTA